MKYDLSIIVPSIRTNNLEQLYWSAEKSVGPYSFEFIVVTPYSKDIPEQLSSQNNVKVYQDFGSPSRCVQIGSMLAEGKQLCWVSDDGSFQPNALKECLDLYESGQANEKDAICLRYIEGNDVNAFGDSYWTAWTHPDQRLAGIKKHFRCAPLGMYNTFWFRELGGLDCRYLHINFCTHDLAFRIQNANGNVFLSPSVVARFFWSWNEPDAKPVQRAYHENDKDLYKTEWDQDREGHIKIDYWNWTKAESKWKMRFGE